MSASRLDVLRPFWNSRLTDVWKKVPLVWLTGVRRVGKTTMAQQIKGALRLNCDLPSSARRLADPERFYGEVESEIVIFDEIHRLPDPSLVLKIGTDAFPHLRILATGSSTLAATRKFRDSLTGRKGTVHLLPVLDRELEAFGVKDVRRRLLHGGLPEALLAQDKDPVFFAEWLDSYFARDVQELFNVGKRREFLRLVEVALRNSGGLMEITGLSRQCGLSRPTVMNYLEALEVTHILTVLRPYHAGGRQEILRQPKAYGFDTGFVSFVRGWERLREEDCGVLWEHFVLETILSVQGPRDIRFWRDKQRREIDFVILGARGHCDAIECKWDAAEFSIRNLKAFRERHPAGVNYVISPQPEPPYTRDVGGHEIVFTNLRGWADGRTKPNAADKTEAR